MECLTTLHLGSVDLVGVSSKKQQLDQQDGQDYKRLTPLTFAGNSDSDDG